MSASAAEPIINTTETALSTGVAPTIAVRSCMVIVNKTLEPTTNNVIMKLSKDIRNTASARSAPIAGNGRCGGIGYIIATEPLEAGLMDRLMPGDRVVSDTRKIVYYHASCSAARSRRRTDFQSAALLLGQALVPGDDGNLPPMAGPARCIGGPARSRFSHRVFTRLYLIVS